jgi:hypothetical protein
MFLNEANEKKQKKYTHPWFPEPISSPRSPGGAVPTKKGQEERKERQ